MVINKLKLNQDKTEVVLISSRYRPKPPLEDSLQIGNITVVPSSTARNLGVIFAKCLNFEDHIKSICKSSYYHIRNIAKISKTTLTRRVPELLFMPLNCYCEIGCLQFLPCYVSFTTSNFKIAIYSKHSRSSC